MTEIADRPVIKVQLILVLSIQKERINFINSNIYTNYWRGELPGRNSNLSEAENKRNCEKEAQQNSRQQSKKMNRNNNQQ